VSKKWLLIVISLTLSVLWLSLIVQHQKISAFWGPFSVMLVSIVLALGAGIIFLLVPWFHNQETVPAKFILLCAIVFFVSAYGGIYMTEPENSETNVSLAGAEIPETGSSEYYQERYARSRAGGTFYYWFYSGGSYSSSSGSASSLSSFDMPSCSGKACQGYAMLLLLLCALLVIIASFVLPHFWVAGSLIFLCFLWMLALREFALVEDYSYYPRKRKSHDW